jgi:hypothetical protein
VQAANVVMGQGVRVLTVGVAGEARGTGCVVGHIIDTQLLLISLACWCFNGVVQW